MVNIFSDIKRFEILKDFILDIAILAMYLTRRLTSVKVYNCFENLSSVNEYNVLVILNLKDGRSTHFLSTASNLRLFNGRTKWLIFGEDVDTSLNVLKTQNINVDSKILLVIPSAYSPYLIYHIRSPALQRNGLLYVNEVGSYSNQDILNFQDPFQRVNYSMDAIVLKIATSVRRRDVLT